jgi:hypothetical protein
MQPGEFVDASIANIVTFGFDKVEPPSPLYVQRDDILLLQVFTTVLAQETVNFNVRLLQVPFLQGGQPSDEAESAPEGKTISQGNIISLQKSVINANPYSVVFVQMALTEGYLLAVAANPQGATQRGQTFVRCAVIRAGLLLTPLSSFQVLFADYVTGDGPTGWPGGRIVGPTEGPGRIYQISVGNPAAGADWTTQFSAFARDRIICANAQLLTSAAAGNRLPRAQIVDGSGNLVFQGSPTQAIVASTTAQVSFYPDPLASVVDVTTVAVALPGQDTIGAANAATGAIFRTNTLGILAGDQWSNIHILVEEWLDQL